jgi:hypothetical protein
VPIGVGGSYIKDWEPGGANNIRIGVAARRLAAIGITAPTGVLIGQGESDLYTAGAVYQASLQATINSALRALPRDQRVVAELCLLQGKTPAEVATGLGVPASTVTSRLTNGRQRLRRLLRSSEIDEPSWLIGNSQVSAEPAPPTTRSGT